MNREPNRESKYQGPVKAMFTGIMDLFRKPADQLELHDADRLDGKKVLITGASSGLGLATATELAKRGAHVIMLMRSGIPEKGELVKRKSGSDNVEMLKVDLSDPASLPGIAAEISNRFGKIDVAICNAAMVAKNGREVHGVDEMFLVNYLAKFIFINALLDAGVFSTGGTPLPRIIFVASESHRNPDRIDWGNFGKYVPYGTGKSVAMYGYYKLLLVTLARELDRRLNNGNSTSVAVHALCPGPVNSNIAREAPVLFQPLLKLVFGIFFRSPAKACRPVVYLAASKEVEGVSGKYLFLMQEKPVDSKADDPENGAKLWHLSQELGQAMLKES